jgi:O-antigen/teichoic acid export membrane protein
MAYATVLMPKLASITEKRYLRVQFWSSLLAAAVMACVILVASFLSPWLVPLAIGAEYGRSVAVLQILLWGMALFTLNVPFSSTLSALELPQVFAINSVAEVALTFGLNAWLIPSYGALGAAITAAVSFGIPVISCGGITLVKLSKQDR